jgi:hypothetical protein
MRLTHAGTGSRLKLTDSSLIDTHTFGLHKINHLSTPMCATKKHAEESRALPAKSKRSVKVFHAMRNGHLYRSLDGVSWELETDPDVSVIPEGTSRTTLSE